VATSCAHRAVQAPPLEPAPVGFTLLPASNSASSQPSALVNRPALVLIRQRDIEADRLLAKTMLAGHTEEAKDDARIAQLQALVSPWRLYGVPTLTAIGAALIAGFVGYEIGHAK